MLRVFPFFITIVLMAASCRPKPEEVKIIPQPAKLEIGGGSVVWDNTIAISAADDQLSNFTKAMLSEKGYTVVSDDDDRINLALTSMGSSVRGGYVLISEGTVVTITAADPEGLFYGLQTLSQIVPNFEGSKVTFETVKIEDQPRFRYRGFHLDCGRHMLPVEFIKKYIDVMAHYKYNTFHWHLTEDQGWRIEIQKYPKLAEVAAYRNETVIGYATTKTRAGRSYDGKRYGGFYTQQDIKDVVAYAAERFVTVIPEIEMPGHAQAALAAYPELGCTGGPYETAQTWGIFDDVFCAGKEGTFTFLEGVIDEVVTLFPSEYIHIGGDECPKVKWKTCPNCQKRMKSLGLKTEDELQSYFIQRMEKYVNSKGRKIIGWDEILEGGLAPNATVMSWRGTEGGTKAAEAGHEVIMTPDEFVYLNYIQDTSKTEPLAIDIFLPIEKVYSYDPCPPGSSEKLTLGAQVNVWTEYIHNPDEAEYMIFPRAIAMSEVLWTPMERKDYRSFLSRMENQWPWLDMKSVNYAKHIKK